MFVYKIELLYYNLKRHVETCDGQEYTKTQEDEMIIFHNNA